MCVPCASHGLPGGMGLLFGPEYALAVVVVSFAVTLSRVHMVARMLLRSLTRNLPEWCPYNALYLEEHLRSRCGRWVFLFDYQTIGNYRQTIGKSSALGLPVAVVRQCVCSSSCSFLRPKGDGRPVVGRVSVDGSSCNLSNIRCRAAQSFCACFHGRFTSCTRCC